MKDVDIIFNDELTLTLDCLQHKCDPKVGKEHTFMFIEYLCQVNGMMFTIETKRIEAESVEVVKSLTFGEFKKRFPEFRVYARGGHFSNYENKESEQVCADRDVNDCTTQAA